MYRTCPWGRDEEVQFYWGSVNKRWLGLGYALHVWQGGMMGGPGFALRMSRLCMHVSLRPLPAPADTGTTLLQMRTLAGWRMTMQKWGACGDWITHQQHPPLRPHGVNRPGIRGQQRAAHKQLHAVSKCVLSGGARVRHDSSMPPTKKCLAHRRHASIPGEDGAPSKASWTQQGQGAVPPHWMMIYWTPSSPYL